MTKDGLVSQREGVRAVVKDEHDNYSLGKYMSGQLPYFYRKVEGIVADFASQHSALESVLALAASMPTAKSFQNSHCGEIMAAQFVEQHLNYKRLYSKLTLITSQNTNAHKMDGLFVDCATEPFKYLFVEAKSSILPTASSPTKTHRSGILKQMISSLEKYHDDDPRFELSRIRDNLAQSFPEEVACIIRRDLMPPGPSALDFVGITVTNHQTVNNDDDDFILSTSCALPFKYYALVVTDLSKTAEEAYGIWQKIGSSGS